MSDTLSEIDFVYLILKKSIKNMLYGIFFVIPLS